MKHLLTFVMLMSIGLFVWAQPTIVSTSPSNRNVLIEEYTGINCGYCPNGHAYGNTVLTNNQGHAWVINIHQGSYANATPDYRTSFGDALFNQIGSTGYPCGTVNRHVFSGSVTNVNYTTWPSVATTVRGMSSPVNIAIDVDLDYNTRKLTILVEVYYTANSAVSTNKLNVALLQNWVKGPQSNYGNYNSAYITSDGQYYHMHMLRNLLTGQWGVVIPTTTAGTFFDTTFVYDVPNTLGLGNIPVSLPNLEVVAFVTEGNQEVLNAHGMMVPPAPIDASVSSIGGAPTSYCANTFTPSVTIKNVGTTTLTSLDIEYTFDNGTAQTYSWTGSLATNATDNITLPANTITTSGSHTFSASTKNPNASVDMNTSNDAQQITFTTILNSINPPVTQNFSATTFPPNDWVLTEPTPNGTNWKRSTQGCTAAGSAMINWYAIPSGIDDLMSYKMNFSGMSGMGLSFNYAYKQYNSSSNDKLQVDISTNCGASWTTLWQKAGSALATAPATTSNYSTVAASDWKNVIVDLNSYSGQSEVLIRFRATSGYGNNLYLDDINISNNTGIVEFAPQFGLNVYPNPASDFTTISIEAENQDNANIVIVNSIGEVVYNSTNNIDLGVNNININTENFSNGVYFVRIITSKGNMNSSFVVGR